MVSPRAGSSIAGSWRILKAASEVRVMTEKVSSCPSLVCRGSRYGWADLDAVTAQDRAVPVAGLPLRATTGVVALNRSSERGS